MSDLLRFMECLGLFSLTQAPISESFNNINGLKKMIPTVNTLCSPSTLLLKYWKKLIVYLQKLFGSIVVNIEGNNIKTMSWNQSQPLVQFHMSCKYHRNRRRINYYQNYSPDRRQLHIEHFCGQLTEKCEQSFVHVKVDKRRRFLSRRIDLEVFLLARVTLLNAGWSPELRRFRLMNPDPLFFLAVHPDPLGGAVLTQAQVLTFLDLLFHEVPVFSAARGGLSFRLFLRRQNDTLGLGDGLVRGRGVVPPKKILREDLVGDLKLDRARPLGRVHLYIANLHQYYWGTNLRRPRALQNLRIRIMYPPRKNNQSLSRNKSNSSSGYASPSHRDLTKVNKILENAKKYEQGRDQKRDYMMEGIRNMARRQAGEQSQSAGLRRVGSQNSEVSSQDSDRIQPRGKDIYRKVEATDVVEPVQPIANPNNRTQSPSSQQFQRISSPQASTGNLQPNRNAHENSQIYSNQATYSTTARQYESVQFSGAGKSAGQSSGGYSGNVELASLKYQSGSRQYGDGASQAKIYTDPNTGNISAGSGNSAPEPNYYKYPVQSNQSKTQETNLQMAATGEGVGSAQAYKYTPAPAVNNQAHQQPPATVSGTTAVSPGPLTKPISTPALSQQQVRNQLIKQHRDRQYLRKLQSTETEAEHSGAIRAQLERLVQESTDMRARFYRAEEERGVLAERLRAAEQDNSTLRSENEQLKLRLKNCEFEIGSLQNYKQMSENQLRDMRSNKQSVYDDLMTKLNELNIEVRKKSNEIMRLERMCSQLEASTAERSYELTRLRQQLGKKEEELLNLHQKQYQANKMSVLQARTQGEVKNYLDRIQALETENNNLKRQLNFNAKTEQQTSRLKHQIQEMLADMKDLQFQLVEKDKLIAQYKSYTGREEEDSRVKLMQQELEAVMKQRAELVKSYEMKILDKDRRIHELQAMKYESTGEQYRLAGLEADEAEFQDILKQQVEQINNLKRENSAKMSELFQLKLQLENTRSQLQNESNKAKILSLQLQTNQKASHSITDSHLRAAKNEVESLNRRIEQLTQAVEARRKENVNKDEFIKQYLIGGKKDSDVGWLIGQLERVLNRN